MSVGYMLRVLALWGILASVSCAWNEDGTFNYAKTYDNIFGEGQAVASSSAAPQVIGKESGSFDFEGKFKCNSGKSMTYSITKESGKNSWTLNIPVFVAHYKESGKEFVRGNDEYFTCHLAGNNKLFCPLIEDDEISRDCASYVGKECGVTITQVDKNTVNVDVVGASFISGSGVAPDFPEGMCRR